MLSTPLIRRFLEQALLPMGCLIAMAYFAHHALFDDHGLRRLLSLKAEVAEHAQARDAERARRAELEAKVKALQAQHIDPDLLDERARETLGLARPDEIIIYKQK
jgi:cell division protein FtsB